MASSNKPPTLADQPEQGSTTEAPVSPPGGPQATPASTEPSPSSEPATPGPVQDPATTAPTAVPPSSGAESQPSAESSGTDAPPEPTFEEQQAAAAAAQSPAEPQVVPEQRPQVFVSPDPSAQSSTAQKQAEEGSMQGAAAATQEDIDRANSDDAKTQAAENSRVPRYLPGQRVTLVKGDHQGRMGYVLSVVYKDAVQQMIAGSGTPEAMYAEVDSYVVRTRDGRNDTFYVTSDEIQPLEINEGWSRGFI